MDPTFILTIVLIAGVMCFLWWRAEREDRKGYLMRQPTRAQVNAGGESALVQAKKILKDHHRKHVVGAAEEILRKRERKRP
jgi:hypothetical protein